MSVGSNGRRYRVRIDTRSTAVGRQWFIHVVGPSPKVQPSRLASVKLSLRSSHLVELALTTKSKCDIRHKQTLAADQFSALTRLLAFRRYCIFCQQIPI